MSMKQKRIHRLVLISNSIGAIADDAKYQTPESIKTNMDILREEIRDLLKMDGISSISPTSIGE